MEGNIYKELADCIEQLRWTLAGYQAGGVIDWPHAAPPPEPEPAQPPLPQAHAVPALKPQETAGEKMPEIAASLAGCKRCRLHSGRKNLVFGEGSTDSGIVFVGEGPGMDEDKEGRPFVGRAGKLLDKMIRAIGFDRREVYICNVVKCRPPGNRTPESEEIETCSPFLFRQIEALGPRVICALGACAAQTLLRNTQYISQLRGRIHMWRGIPLICTYHPAYLLRNPAHKAAAWQDLKEVLELARTKHSN